MKTKRMNEINTPLTDNLRLASRAIFGELRNLTPGIMALRDIAYALERIAIQVEDLERRLAAMS